MAAHYGKCESGLVMADIPPVSRMPFVSPEAGNGEWVGTMCP